MPLKIRGLTFENRWIVFIQIDPDSRSCSYSGLSPSASNCPASYQAACLARSEAADDALPSLMRYTRPKNRTPRRGGSRVSRTGREESGPLSDPRQIAARAMYKSPPRTSSAPSPIRSILASQFIATTHNSTGRATLASGCSKLWSYHERFQNTGPPDAPGQSHA
jgi:hypothetical protein